MRDIQHVAVVGTGYMGGGIAQSFALAGAHVQLADVDAEATRRNLERLLAEADRFEASGLYAPGSADLLRDRLHVSASLEEAVGDVDFVEEAVFEDPAVKLSVLRRVDAAVRPGTIVGTNTSTIPVKVLAEAFTDPSHFLTVHFSNPAPFIPGVEIVAGERTDPEVVRVVRELVARMGRRSAQVADVPGFVLNRLQYALFLEAAAVVAEGVATPEDVDTIVSTTFGFRLPFFGPFAIADMAGLDVYAKGLRIMQEARGDRFAPPEALTDLVDAGKHGTKTGSGFFALPADQREALIAYRDRAYVRMQQLLDELGPSPLQSAAGERSAGADPS